ncbi:MAG: sigma-70 family RNA polymerase sigma factor [Planctomycetales bacterium]|nr:sigma-70 family RNA polymerase sigma factor [Planctomycetales bacterium]
MTVMDQSHFEALWNAAAPRVRVFLAAACRDTTLVDDFFQEVAMTAWRKRREFDESRQFDAWIIGMARFVVLRHRRDVARQRVILAPDLIERLEALATADPKSTDEQRQSLAACVQTLDEPAKTLLGMRYQEGQPLAEVARQLGRSHGAIRTALSRLRDSLRQCVRDRLGGPPGNT